MNILKTILEKVTAPMADADDLAPSDNEALELAEQELEATKMALETTDAENDRLHKALRQTEDLIVYSFDRLGGAELDPDKEQKIAELVLIAKARPTRPVFVRK
jgi:hypothetical protein